MHTDMSTWPTGRLLSVAARSVEQAWRSTLEGFGLSHAGLVVLHLTASGPMALTELAREARVTVQTMGRTVENLVKSGHVRLERDPADARRRIVERTPLGDEAFARIHDLEGHGFEHMEREALLRELLLEIITTHPEGLEGADTYRDAAGHAAAAGGHPASTLEG